MGFQNASCMTVVTTRECEAMHLVSWSRGQSIPSSCCACMHGAIDWSDWTTGTWFNLDPPEPFHLKTMGSGYQFFVVLVSPSPLTVGSHLGFEAKSCDKYDHILWGVAHASCASLALSLCLIVHLNGRLSLCWSNMTPEIPSKGVNSLPIQKV